MAFLQKHKKSLAGCVGALALGAVVYGVWQYQAAQTLKELQSLQLLGGMYSAPVEQSGKWYRIPAQEIFPAGEVGSVVALHNPEVTTLAASDDVLADELGGVSVTVGNSVRFYPVQIMNWHEVVHDTLGDTSVLVYYAPLTGAATAYTLPSGMTFSVSNQEYNNDVLLVQEGTETLWSGVWGIPVSGVSESDLSQTLARIPSEYMTWAQWKERYGQSGKDLSVLSTATGVARDYTRHPYGNYEKSPGVYFPIAYSSWPVKAKESAYVAQTTQGAAVFIDTPLLLDATPQVMVGDTSIVALRATSTLLPVRLFNAMLDGQLLTFTRDISGNTFTDTETGSTWNADGKAVAGSLAGKTLVEIPSVRMYTFAANALFPSAELGGREFIFDEEEPVEVVPDDGLDGSGASVQE